MTTPGEDGFRPLLSCFGDKRPPHGDVKERFANGLPQGPRAPSSYNPRVPAVRPALPPAPGPQHRVVLPAPGLGPPLAGLRALRARRHPFLRLAAGTGHRGTPWSFLAADPTEVLRIGRTTPRQRLAERLAPARPVRLRCHGPSLPFGGGWAGMIGYEARSAVEAQPDPRAAPLGFPSLWLGRYEAVAAWNHRSGDVLVSGQGASRALAERRARQLLRLLRRPPPARPARGALAGRPRPQVDAPTFQASISAAREAVLRGDIFQANISQRFDARIAGAPLPLFERLVASQPAPYMTYCDVGRGRTVLSASPERFLRVRGREVETDPMKGTRPRGATRSEDRALRAELEASAKDRAELAMIVDLSRNDLARVCEPGSVRVRVARRLLAFARVHQAIGVVRGRLRPGLDRIDALEAAFPPGSVTGAPKVRAMEIIDELEGEGRGAYCGALGWMDDAGDMDLSVAIRTILLTPHSASYRVGGGITLGSTPHDEWRESLDKGRGLFAALCGEEDDA